MRWNENRDKHETSYSSRNPSAKHTELRPSKIEKYLNFLYN